MELNDIVWIKNILRNAGDDWAYDNVICEQEFLLHWSTRSADTPKIGDIIVLFQTPKRVHERNNKTVYLTHLVTPITKSAERVDDNPKHPWARKVKLVAKASPIFSIPNPGHFIFHKPNRGPTNPIVNLENNIGLTEFQTKQHLASLFEKYLCPDFSNSPEEIATTIYPTLEVMEGLTKIQQHIFHEQRLRNSAIVSIAKSEALKRGNGRVLCECCDFDFFSTYGNLGQGFIECHHKIFISMGQRMTRIEDLAMVCSNCHRMLHKRYDNNHYLTVDELRHLLKG